MTTYDRRRPVVVGATRTRVSRRAVMWAADEAARRQLPLRLVHAQEWPGNVPPTAGQEHPHHVWSRHFRAEGQTLLEMGRLAAEERHPGIEVDVLLAEGRAVRILRDQGDQAGLLVLGARHEPEIEGVFTFGGLGTSLVGHPPCPVALTFGMPLDDWETGPVVVGVDGSAVSQDAVAYGYEEAALRETELVALEVRRPRTADYLRIADESQAELSEALAGWREKYPEVRVRQDVLYGSPALTLARAAQDAQLLVVGSRGRGGFRGMVVGSTSRTLAHRALCPLVVVPPQTSPQR
ncbi:universal stress protein [Streptomyces sp. ICBB 8177]|uniref:universal stress protein n=1 Tax=Streptomyces sp. ICBB 8177 TaxID=563922 RepID=UPI000D6808BD|nr:universal stress protein [Streptomyces sp. ICBB 8177]PWI44727.1 hypothetical protein CK485_05775 [Streptomyces sp. ICBB 8177]